MMYIIPLQKIHCICDAIFERVVRIKVSAMCVITECIYITNLILYLESVERLVSFEKFRNTELKIKHKRNFL